ncbi:kelch domain-containing protein 4-like [Argonauta hians]
MGKKNKKDSKGKGKEKTAQKTEKKAEKRLKKELAAKGEEDIEKLIAEFQEKDRERNKVVDEKCDPPSQRCNASLTAHPDKEELVLFGGEYYNGKQMFMYNDLFFYNIKKNEWHKVTAPNAPTPRSSHQAVMLKQGGGQLWIFGGEFSNHSQSQFYHFKDLWVFYLKDKKWEKVKAVGGPSSRSGHRMVNYKKMLVVFGGFNDTARDYKYFNDIHVFNLETYTWIKVTVTGTPPLPRSGCTLLSCPNLNKIFVFGGYSKKPVKKDVDQGFCHTDMFVLMPEGKQEKNSMVSLHWKWLPVKQSGFCPDPRSSMTSTIVPGSNHAVCFGGVYDDEENEETINSKFFNDLYSIDLEKAYWNKVTLSEKKSLVEKKRRRKQEDGSNEDDSSDEESKSEDSTEKAAADLEHLELTGSDQAGQMTSTSSDGVFTVTIGPSSEKSTSAEQCENTSSDKPDPFMPSPRMNCLLAVTGGHLYLYGGLFEEGDIQITLSDFYSLDLNKKQKWNTIIEIDAKKLEWEESDSSDNDKESDSSDSESDMDVDDDDDVPDIEDEESEESYFERTIDYWLQQAKDSAEAENETFSAKQIKKLALRMCQDHLHED